MKIHEYQAKQILARHGVAVLQGHVVTTAEEAATAAEKLGGPVVVVKSQVHAGGRGKGRFLGDVSDADIQAVLAGAEEVPGKGGVRVVKGAAAAAEAAGDMLGKTLVTKQTGAEGSKVNTVYIEAGCDIARELYLGVLLDRDVGKVVVMASVEGGTEIEEVAEHNPELILKVHADPITGLGAWQARELAFGLGLTGAAYKSAVKFILKLYTAFMAEDCAMAEINPMVVTGAGEVVALDCKMSFDENAMYRHKANLEMRDFDEEEPSEIEAGKYDLSFVKLDGNIGCMVHGAGLAMATMDIIKFYGSEPANFLDVGGGATEEKVTAAFKIITADPAVEGIFVNIFGGIMKCDVIAAGCLAAVKEVGLTVPLVVRLAGTNVEEGKKLLNDSDLAVISADSMADGAQKIVNAVNAAKGA